MQRYFLYLAYDGKAYCGWQIQPNGVSVQYCLELALATLLREKTSAVGAGRTDSGVHARRMVVHFDAQCNSLDNAGFVGKLNSLLPADIAVNQLRKVYPDAHARFDALSRTYQYLISTEKNPFSRQYAWEIRHEPDIKMMNEAAKILFEYTDFTSFSKLHTGTKTNNCRIMKAEWQRVDNLYVFTVQADRFLRNMVRAIVGTLLDVGRGKTNLTLFREIIERKNRCCAGASVAAHGLALIDVAYPDDIFIANS
ncbi:MAG: tRNA pseudouridine(38-40) synthase TruA [Bacteroidales bacterium]|jgi:tRNA pseudouridine38-40 synthase|nr:tRNA pseudouridine(38-40) synthase TruA [Bacteroidales bacterium]